MRRVLLVALLAVSCGSPPCDGASCDADAGAGGGAGGGGGSSLEAWQQELLDAHNRVRANAMPAPSPALPALTWNTDAQALAQSWVDQCTWAHNPATGSTYGENIFAASGASDTPTQVVDAWASESANYTYATNSCATGTSCGHYTQLVWRTTTSVGCATKRCAVNSPFGAGEWTFWVCDYAPPGNFVGRKPY